MDVDALAKATARLGEAAFDPALWPELLQDIACGVGAFGAVLLQSGTPTGDMPWSPSLLRLREDYHRGGWNLRDIRAARSVSAFRRGLTVITDEDLVSADERAREPYYSSFIASHRLRDFVAVGFRLSSSEMCGLVIQRTAAQGAFTDAEKRILAELAPSLTATAELARMLGEASARGSLRALDGLSRPALAFGRGCAVLAANDAAAALFDGDFCIRAGALAIRDRDAAAALRAACDRSGSLRDASARRPDTIVVPRAGRPPLLLRALPLDGPAGSFMFGAGLLVTVTDPAAAAAPEPELLAALFGTTPAEARLAVRLAAGVGLAAAARAGGISVETARSQLKALFTKTGTGRQAELVVLLGRLGR